MREIKVRISTSSSRSLEFESFGVCIGITLDDPSLVDPVMEVLPPSCTPIEGFNLHRRYHLGPGNSLRIDGSPEEAFHDQAALLDALEGDIQLHVAEFATPHLFVHAGVVEWNGRAIILPGRSFAGKSTLVTSLVKAGATYYSDEYAVLNADGMVLPYPRRVSLRPGPHGPAGRLDLRDRAPHDLDMRAALPVGLVALLTYAPGGSWDVETLSAIAGMMSISEQTVAIRHRPEDTFEILGKVVTDATVIQGTRGEVGDAVQALLAMDVVHGEGETGAAAPGIPSLRSG